jgi:nitronate monooxygenase
MQSLNPSPRLEELLVAGNFVEVWLAREGHDNPVGINFLEKIQLPNLASIFGAMLAGVHYVLMGAGIPTAIPGVLDELADGKPVKLRIDVGDAARDAASWQYFDPTRICDGNVPKLERPKFLAIIASVTMARVMVNKASGKVDGLVIEAPSAGGHNAPPRGRLQLNETNEPIYGPRDVPDLEQIAAFGLPFWLAGSSASPERLAEALAHGATGIQVGTAFAYCDESGIAPSIRERVLAQSTRGEAEIFTDPIASPTGFPFKVVQLSDTMSDQATYEARTRICDLGYLRHAYTKESGTIAWRCPSEPVADYVRKGGDIADTVGRKCVCNGLMATIDLEQVRKDGYHELPIVTSGDDVQTVARFLKPGQTTYSAGDVIDHLLSAVPSSA